jgi:hypothetical protein
MGCYGIPEKLIIMTKSMYEDSECAVVDGSGITLNPACSTLSLLSTPRHILFF